MMFQSCYFSKTIEGPCTMRIEFKDSPILKRPDNPKYIDYATNEQYQEAFLQGLEEELSSMGVVITKEAQSEFVLLITSLTLQETVSISTVDDASSTYHGQSYALHSCDADAEFTLYRNTKKVSSGWAGVSKDEKLSNNRNFGDYLFGTNKDNSEYRYKGLDSEICMDLSKRCGRRTAARITKKVSKAIK
jgi:hypothetical protein